MNSKVGPTSWRSQQGAYILETGSREMTVLALLLPICVFMLESRVPRVQVLLVSMFLFGSAFVEYGPHTATYYAGCGTITTLLIFTLGAIMLVDLLSRKP